jgi:hypothetical protein
MDFTFRHGQNEDVVSDDVLRQEIDDLEVKAMIRQTLNGESLGGR